MAHFKFHLIGASQAPVINVDAETVSEVAALASSARWISGEIVEIDGEPTFLPVAIPTARIQMVLEVVA